MTPAPASFSAASKLPAAIAANGLLAQLIGRLALDLSADRRRGDAQALHETHRVARHVLARERLDLGRAGARRKEQQDKGERAQRVKHGSTLDSTCGVSERTAGAEFCARVREQYWLRRRESSTVEARSTKTASASPGREGGKSSDWNRVSIRKPHDEG